MALEHLSPQRPACLVDKSRPASQSGLAVLLKAVDPATLRAVLVEVAEDHAFSWDAHSMLGRVAEEAARRQVSAAVSATELFAGMRTVFEPKHGTAARWHECDCTDCTSGLAADQSSNKSAAPDDHLS